MSQSQRQAEFFATLGDPAVFRQMFDHLADVFFFAKDRDSRLFVASRPILDRLGVSREEDLIGSRDEDFFPEAVAHSFREDDQFVFSTGTTLTDRLEMWYDERRSFDWFLTTKVPLRGPGGDVVGLMGVTRRAGTFKNHPFAAEASTLMSYLEQHTDRIVSTAEVAEVCGVSERTLNRRVTEILGTTPYDLMLQIRVRRAAESLIESDNSILDIAKSHGFCDQSTFTQHFRKRTGLTPKKFRARHRLLTGTGGK
jgi:AraC-like DNA-binding protein